MSQRAIKITLLCEPEVEEGIEIALSNSGIQFTSEEVKTPEEGYCLYIPDALWALSVALHILEAKKDLVKGSIELPDGKKHELTQKGRADLNELLIKTMSRKRAISTAEAPWWLPFIPEVKEFLKRVNSLVEWYPKASGEGRRIVTRNFLYLIGGIVLGTGILTFFGKISGDSFAFVIGSLLGYTFAFLQRYLGILTEE